MGSSDAVLAQWEKIKTAERKKAGKQTRSALDHIPSHLPALMRAEKLQKKAVKAGLVASGEPAKALRQAIRDWTRKKDRKTRAGALSVPERTVRTPAARFAFIVAFKAVLVLPGTVAAVLPEMAVAKPIAASSVTGHSCSQMPQPMHSAGSTYGRRNVMGLPSRFVIVTSRE